jgi:hypothetical protein
MEKLKTYSLLALTLTLVIAFTLASTVALQRAATPGAVVVGTPVSLGEVIVEADRVPLTPSITKDEILWLARAIYSETKRPNEQELVAWTIRNRFETAYRGKNSYQSVVLDPWQFSAFNRNSRKRSHYMSLTDRSNADGFKTAIGIAKRVATADETLRPFPKTTRHFYSERSMVGRRAPAWAANRQPVRVNQPIDPRRFRFYANIM